MSEGGTTFGIVEPTDTLCHKMTRLVALPTSVVAVNRTVVER